MGFRLVRPEGFRIPGAGRPADSRFHQGRQGTQGVRGRGIGYQAAANKLTIKIHTSRRAWLSAKRGRKLRTCAAGWKNWSPGTRNRRARGAQTRDQRPAGGGKHRPATGAPVSFRRAMKKSVGQSLKFGAKGIKIRCKGRLAGAEIARQETYREGRVPLHTLRPRSTTVCRSQDHLRDYRGEDLDLPRRDPGAEEMVTF